MRRDVRRNAANRDIPVFSMAREGRLEWLLRDRSGCFSRFAPSSVGGCSAGAETLVTGRESAFGWHPAADWGSAACQALVACG